MPTQFGMANNYVYANATMNNEEKNPKSLKMALKLLILSVYKRYDKICAWFMVFSFLICLLQNYFTIYLHISTIVSDKFTRHPSGCFSNAIFPTACTAPAHTYFTHGFTVCKCLRTSFRRGGNRLSLWCRQDCSDDKKEGESK